MKGRQVKVTIRLPPVVMVWLPILLIFILLVLRTTMYTQALKSGGGVAQRLNQHFNKAIRVWDLSAMPFHQSGAGCFLL